MINNHQPFVEEPGAKYLLYIFFIVFLYSPLQMLQRGVCIWNNKESFEITSVHCHWLLLHIHLE